MLTCSKKYFRINDRKIDRIMDALQKILVEEREYSEVNYCFMQKTLKYKKNKKKLDEQKW